VFGHVPVVVQIHRDDGHQRDRALHVDDGPQDDPGRFDGGHRPDGQLQADGGCVETLLYRKENQRLWPVLRQTVVELVIEPGEQNKVIQIGEGNGDVDETDPSRGRGQESVYKNPILQPFP